MKYLAYNAEMQGRSFQGKISEGNGAKGLLGSQTGLRKNPEGSDHSNILGIYNPLDEEASLGQRAPKS